MTSWKKKGYVWGSRSFWKIEGRIHKVSKLLLLRKEEMYKRKENELWEKDLKIQESLIKFSKYL